VILIIKYSGHRGYKAIEIENTWLGFLKAIEEKLDYIELDVRVSSDNVLVVFHDKKINRLLNGNGKINSFSLKELKSFNYSDGQKILTLEELFDKAKGKIKFIIDVKSKGIENQLIQLIKKYNLENDVIIQSFSGKIIKKCYLIDQNLDYCIYRPFIGKILRPHKIFAPLFYHFLFKPYKIKYVSLDGPFMYDRILSIMKEKGLKIILGAMKTEKYLKNIKKWGISIINANNPKRIKELLKKMN